MREHSSELTNLLSHAIICLFFVDNLLICFIPDNMSQRGLHGQMKVNREENKRGSIISLVACN